jgi:HAD superfamily hydrolase (TIGR01490 family)
MDLALFDFDGTITSGESFGPFVKALAPRWRVRIGGLLLAPLVIGYRLGWVSGITVRAAVVRIAFRGRDATAFDAAARTFSNDYLPTVVRPDALARIAWHRVRGDRVVVVSGAFSEYLQPWCDSLGLELVASALERRDGRLTGRYAGAQCVLDEKIRRLRERVDLARFDRIHAYGDTPEDQPMLALAHERYYRTMPA